MTGPVGPWCWTVISDRFFGPWCRTDDFGSVSRTGGAGHRPALPVRTGGGGAGASRSNLFVELLAEGGGAVGGDRFGAVVDEAAGGLDVVDGPDVVGVSRFVEAIDELFVHGAVGVGGEAVGTGRFQEGEGFVGGRGEAPAAAIVGDDEVGLAVGAGFFPSGDEVGVEGDDDNLILLEGAGGEGFFEGGDHLATGFDFDKDFLFSRNGGEHLREGGDAGAGEFFILPTADVEGLQFGEGGLGDDEFFACEFFGVFVVEADDVAVFGELEVALDGVGSSLPCEFESGEGVLGGVGGGSAMGNDEKGEDEFDHDGGAALGGVFG